MGGARRYDAVVIGTSAGGLQALIQLFKAFPAHLPVPLLVVQHLRPDSGTFLAEILSRNNKLTVKQAEDKEPLAAGHVYLAPPNYHLLVEVDLHIALSTEARVNFTRPAVDVLFESAARVFGARLIGVVLTGANSDGCQGAVAIHNQGGYVIVQDPKTAEAAAMPAAVLQCGVANEVLPVAMIGERVLQLLGR